MDGAKVGAEVGARELVTGRVGAGEVPVPTMTVNCWWSLEGTPLLAVQLIV